MKVKDTVELNVIVTQFCDMTIAEMNKDGKTKLHSILQELAKDCHVEKYTVVSWFRAVQEDLVPWQKENVFSDNEVFFTIACEIAEFFLSKERTRDKPDSHHISFCEREVGNMMAYLGFFEKALDFYRQAVSSMSWFYVRDTVVERLLYILAVKYLKSGQKIDRIDEMVNEVVSNIISYAIARINDSTESYRRYWESPIKEARESLVGLGYCEESEQNQKLQSVYEAVISTLSKMRESSITYDNERRDKPINFEESGYCANYLAEIHRLVGDEQSAVKWEQIYSNAKVF